jgi:hypothetical protein
MLDKCFPQVPAVQLEEALTRKICLNLSYDRRVSHCKFMCDEAWKLADEGRVEKAMRWLGFLQGVFWDDGTYTLDELKNHSKP